MCAPCACVVPIAPQFDDPLAAQNFPPAILDTFPVNGAVVPTRMFTATITDPNVSDDLYILWIADFPPFDTAKSRRLAADNHNHQPGATAPQIVETTITVDCFMNNLAAGIAQHQIMMIVADRPFLPANEQTSQDRKYTTLPSDALRAEAHWTLTLECPTTIPESK